MEHPAAACKDSSTLMYPVGEVSGKRVPPQHLLYSFAYSEISRVKHAPL
jgi:hypothetical protein